MVFNSPNQDYFRSDDHTQPTYEMTPEFQPFTLFSFCLAFQRNWTHIVAETNIKRGYSANTLDIL